MERCEAVVVTLTVWKSGVWPLGVLASISEPRPSRYSMMSTRPVVAAMCSGVKPASSPDLTNAGFLSTMARTAGR